MLSRPGTGATPRSFQLPRLICGLVLFWAALSPTVSLAGGRGPLRTVNRMPTHLMFLTPSPTAPADPDSGRLRGALGIDYTRVFFTEASPRWQALADMELTVIDLSLEYRLTGHLTVGLDIPLASMNAGGLDEFVEDFHGAFGLPNDDRNGRPLNQFGYLLQKDGRAWISPRSGGLHLADSRLSLRRPLLRGATRISLDLDLQYVLKLPVGDAHAGFGSGSFDHGLFLPMAVDRSAWSIYLMPGFIFTGTPDTLGAEVSVRPMGSLFLGLEYAPAPGWSLLGQINACTSPLADTGIRHLDRDSMELTVGVVGQMTRRVELEVAFSEDLTLNAPDFTFHVGLRFGRAGR